jgi:hypothetical protein
VKASKEELITVLTVTARDAYEWISPALAEELANGILLLLSEKEAKHQRKLNIVHSFYCAVFYPGENGEQRECDCGSTTTIPDGMEEHDRSR